MNTKWNFAGAAAALSLLGLAGCSSPDASGASDPAAGGIWSGGGAGGDPLVIEEPGGTPGYTLELDPLTVPTGNDTTTDTGTIQTVTPTDTETKSSTETATETPTDTGTLPTGGDEPPGGDLPTVAPDPGKPPASPEDACPGYPFILPAGTALDVHGSLAGMRDDHFTSCGARLTTSASPDAVYLVELPETSTVRVALASTSFVPALSIRHSLCEGERPGDLCISTGEAVLDATLSLEGGRYWLVVDSGDAQAGPFTLKLEVNAPACGDGVLSPGEDCDVGPGQPNDGCFDPGSSEECLYGEKSDLAGVSP